MWRRSRTGRPGCRPRRSGWARAAALSRDARASRTRAKRGRAAIQGSSATIVLSGDRSLSVPIPFRRRLAYACRMATSDKRKQSLYFPEEMLKEIGAEATRQDRSLSWIVQKAWKAARKDIMNI